MLITAGRANRAIDAAIGRLLKKKLEPSEQRAWRKRPGKDDRGSKGLAASRGVPVRKAIPDDPDWKVRAASRVRKASPGRKDRGVKPAYKARPAR
jgi:hypothetical protein